MKQPSNKPSLDSLKQQGYKVTIRHYRMVLTLERERLYSRLTPDFEWRKHFDKFYFLPEEKGGATELILERGEEKITVRADCYHKDNFCRRIGVAICLEKLERLYGIKA